MPPRYRPYAPRPPVPRRHRFLSALLRWMLVLGITLALVAVLLEGGLRVFAPQIVEPLSGLFQPDTAAGYRFRPNVSIQYRSTEASVTFNIDGDTTRAVHSGYDSSSPTPVERMLALGDAFTFGMNVQDNEAYPAVVARTLNEGDPNPQWDVHNAGVFGYGADNAAGWLEAYGWGYNPRVVVLGFFVGNDVKDVMLGISKTAATDDGRLVATETSREAMQRGDEEQGGGSRNGGIKGWLEGNSHAYLFLRSLWYNTLGKGSSSPRYAHAQLTIFDSASFYRVDVPPEIEEGWRKTLNTIKEMRDDAVAHNAAFVLVAIPTREQVYPSYWEEAKAQFALDEADFDLALPQQKLAEFAAEQGINYVDLLPDFKAESPNGNLYFRTDRHWTPAGHQLAGEVIVKELKIGGIVK